MNFQLPPPGIPVFTPQGFMVRRGTLPMVMPYMGTPMLQAPHEELLFAEIPQTPSKVNDPATERRNLLKEQLLKQITGESEQKQETTKVPALLNETPTTLAMTLTPPEPVPYSKEELLQIQYDMGRKMMLSEFPESADGRWVLDSNIYAPHGSELRLAEGLVQDRPKRGKNSVWNQRSERNSSNTSPEEKEPWSNGCSQGEYEQQPSTSRNPQEQRQEQKYDNNYEESYQSQKDEYNRRKDYSEQYNQGGNSQKYYDDNNYENYQDHQENSCNREVENYNLQNNREKYQQTPSQCDKYEKNMAESSSSQRYKMEAENYSRNTLRGSSQQGSVNENNSFESARRRFEANLHGIKRSQKQQNAPQLTNRYKLPRSNFGIWNYFCRGKPLSEEARKGTVLEGLSDWEIEELFKKMSLEAVGAVYTPPKRNDSRQQDQGYDEQSQRSSGSYQDDRQNYIRE